jgi:hypothetical protein
MLVPEQFGFGQGKSTDNAAFKLTVYLNISIKKMHVLGIVCDLGKAFDCVNHDILLMKFRYYGIHGTVATWFRSYLTNRKQKN